MTPVVVGFALMAALVVLIVAVQWVARHSDEEPGRWFHRRRTLGNHA